MNLLSRTVAELATFIDVWEPRLSDDEKREVLRAVDHIREVVSWRLSESS